MTQLAIGDLFLCEAGIVDLLQLTTNFCFSTRQSVNPNFLNKAVYVWELTC